jgi:protein-S-isoprenylcysteine O-methyltransferase Ste14
MFRLQLKVPPLLLTILFGIAMWGISLVTPALELPTTVRGATCVLLITFGMVVVVAGAISCRRVGTTVNPTTPESSSALVVDGIYQFTRNPMYLGMLLWLAAFSTWLANLYAMALCIAFVFYMNRFQIGPEERALETLFGDSYRDYCERVRRWI